MPPDPAVVLPWPRRCIEWKYRFVTSTEVTKLASSDATGKDWGVGGLVPPPQFSSRPIFQFVQIREEMLGEGGYVLEWDFNLLIMRASDISPPTRLPK